MKKRSAPPEVQTEAYPPAATPRAVAAMVTGACVVVSLLFVVSIYLYGAHAGPSVDRMSRQMGDLIAAQARALAATGDTEAALARYQRALEARFDDPRQRAWTLRAYGDELLRAERPEEAAEALEAAVAMYPDDGVALGLLARAHRMAGDYEAMRIVAQRWVDQAKTHADGRHRAAAWLHLGQALEGLDRTDEARSAYVEGARADPASDSAYHGAVLLDREGQAGEALALLERYLPTATGWRAESGRKLRDRLQGR